MTLSVFVNRIGFGFIVLENDALIDWGVKDLRAGKHATSLAVFRALVEQYRPAVVVMREYQRDITHRGERAKDLLERMHRAARRKRVTVHQVSRQVIQACFAEWDANNKHQVANEIVRRFPELEDRLPRKRRLWESEEYRMAIFDAAALALTYFQGRDRH